MERGPCLARFLLILAIARCRHTTATRATSFSSLNPASSSATASSSSTSSSSSSAAAAASIPCQTDNASSRTLFRCRPDIFQSRSICVGEKWALRCPTATFISILSAQVVAAQNLLGQERCLNITYRPTGTKCAGLCVTRLFEQQCLGKRKCSSKVLPDQNPSSPDFSSCGGSPGTGLEDHPLSVTYACVSRGFLSQSASTIDPDESNVSPSSSSNDCLQRPPRGGSSADNEDDNDDEADIVAADGQQQLTVSGRSLTTPLPRTDGSRSEAAAEPRLPRRPTNEPLEEVIVEVTQLHLDNRRTTSPHRGIVQRRNNSTEQWKTPHPLPMQTISYLTTTIGEGGRSGDGGGSGARGWYGNVSEWIWTWKYIQERRENFFLYMILALLFGVMSVLIVLILRLTQHNRKSHRQLRVSNRRPKSESAPLTSSRGSPVAWRTPESDRSLPPGDEPGGRSSRVPVELTSFNRVGSLPGLDCSTPPPPMPPPPPLVDSPREFHGSEEEFQVVQRRGAEFPVVDGLFSGEQQRRGEYGGGESAAPQRMEFSREEQRTELRRNVLPMELRRGFSHEFLGDVCNDFKKEPRGGEFMTTRGGFARDVRGDFQMDDLRRDFPRDPRRDPQKELCFDYPRNLRSDFPREQRGEYPVNLRGDFQKDLRGVDYTREFRHPAPVGQGISSSHQRPMTATINRSLCGQLNSSSGLRFGRRSFLDSGPVPASVVTPSFTLPGERLFPARRHHSLAGLDYRSTDAAEEEFIGRRSLQQSPCGRDYLIEMELMECLKTLQPVIRQYNREAGFATS